MGLIESWQNDEITMINTKDRLVEIADQIKNREETQEINGLL
jgi:hypothetical protein